MTSSGTEATILSYRLRLQPTRPQRRALEAVCIQQQQLYNAALEERIRAWEKGVSISVFDQGRSLTLIRRDDPPFAAVQRRIQVHTLDRLDRAYKAFFRRAKAGAGASSGFPRFRRRDEADSFGFNAPLQIKWDGKRFRFSGVPGGLRVSRRDRERLPPLIADPRGNGTWKGAQFRRVGDAWWCTVQMVVPAAAHRAGMGRAPIGIDWGTSALIVRSDGHAEPPLLVRTNADAILRRCERKVARSKKGSRRRQKARARKQRVERHIANKRRNRLDKLSKGLVTQFGLVAVEKLAVKSMTSAGPGRDGAPASVQRGRNRRALDAAPAMFRQMMSYKGARYLCDVRTVDAADTTQACSICDAIVPKELTDMMHACPSCGTRLSRKVNAARVILKRALATPSGDAGDGAGRGPAGAAKAANGGRGRRRPRSTSAGNGADGSRSGEPDFHNAQLAERQRGSRGGS